MVPAAKLPFDKAVLRNHRFLTQDLTACAQLGISQSGLTTYLMGKAAAKFQNRSG